MGLGNAQVKSENKMILRIVSKSVCDSSERLLRDFELATSILFSLFLSAFLQNFFLCQDRRHGDVPPHLVGYDFGDLKAFKPMGNVSSVK